MRDEPRRVRRASRVDEEHVDPAVGVEVEEHATRADDLDDEPLVAGAVDVNEVEPRLCGHVTERGEGQRRCVRALLRSGAGCAIGQDGQRQTCGCHRPPR